MTNELAAAIAAVKKHEYSFCKFISSNDAGTTGAHQAGIYIPKNSIEFVFDEPGILGSNKEKFATIRWFDGVVSTCRFIYYGQGSRDEYRITRLGKGLKVDDLIIIAKQDENSYQGFLLKTENERNAFLTAFELTDEDTNKLIKKRNVDRNINDIELASARKSNDLETFEINFRPKAHILILLGEELIKSPVMAIYELIKNGYDADAKHVQVVFHNIENIDNAFIEIEDSGTGITEEVLKNVWFEPGTDHRKPISNEGVRTIRRSPIYNRIPMGEKGVGRFAVHKLGNRIKLVSRPAKIILDERQTLVRIELHEYEITVEIDWRKFSQSKYLEDVNIQWKKNYDSETFMFKETHGTFIQVSNLKEQWTRGMARQLKKQSLSMLSPKNDFSKFNIDLDFQNWWLHDIPDTKDLLKLAPYQLTAFVDTDYNMTFSYDFRLANNNEIGQRSISKDSPEDVRLKKYEYNIKGEVIPYLRGTLEQQELEKPVIENIITEFDVANLPYGNIMLELYSYDLDSSSLKDIINSPKIIKNFLKDHSGVKVFKGDLRVYDYGDPGNDWLGLDIKRVNNKEWFSNNQIIGYVYLDPENSSALIEQTNREGFIHNAAYDNLVVVLDFILSQFMAERQSDRQRWLKFNQKGDVQHSFFNTLSGFKRLISESPLDENNQALLLEEADRVEKKYEEDRGALLIPAGIGMTASFAMHEIEKLIPRMQETVGATPLNLNRIKFQVEELKDYSEGLLSVLRKGNNVSFSVYQAVQQAASNYASRLKAWNIDLQVVLEPNVETIKCDKRLFTTVIMNIIDNSMYWLDTIFKTFKGIFILLKKIENGVSIIIVDNGPGFKEGVDEIIMPYYSRKRNGIGIGMYLVDTVMINYGRLNIVFDNTRLHALGIPEKYSGAAVELIFNKNQ